VPRFETVWRLLSSSPTIPAAGKLHDPGVPSQVAHAYGEGVRRGEVLVAIDTNHAGAGGRLADAAVRGGVTYDGELTVRGGPDARPCEDGLHRAVCPLPSARPRNWEPRAWVRSMYEDILDARAAGVDHWNGEQTYDSPILQANSVGCGVPPGGHHGCRVSLGGAGANARWADRSGATSDAHRDQG
jgi:hypothetical protein